MAERQPIPISDTKRAPHEGDNRALGIPPTLHERAKPPPERSAQGGSDSASVQPEHMQAPIDEEALHQRLRERLRNRRDWEAESAQEIMEWLYPDPQQRKEIIQRARERFRRIPQEPKPEE